jgi:transglutaminase-like putative cysteine protease
VTGPTFQVLHRTTFEYDAPATESRNELHLEPRKFPFQRTLQAFVKILPATRVRRVKDWFDNVTHHFEIPGAHRRLEITSRVRVQNLKLELSAAAENGGMEFYRESEVRERIWPFLQESRYVSRHPEIWRAALDLTGDLDSVYEKSLAMMNWIHREFRYETGSTQVGTHLEEAFGQRHGVCQDFTHVMLGLCRAVGIPARYASGYLYNGPLDDLVGAQASHAWPEVCLPETGWVGFDPTNNTLADDRYIKIAVGRDYDDVAPVKGSYHGTAHCKLSVTVEVEKLEH